MCSISFSECAYIYIYILWGLQSHLLIFVESFEEQSVQSWPLLTWFKSPGEKNKWWNTLFIYFGVVLVYVHPKKVCWKVSGTHFYELECFFSESVFRVVIAGGTIRGVEGRLCRSGALQLQKAIVLSASFSHSVLKSASSSAQLDMLSICVIWVPKEANHFHDGFLKNLQTSRFSSPFPTGTSRPTKPQGCWNRHCSVGDLGRQVFQNCARKGCLDAYGQVVAGAECHKGRRLGRIECVTD